jgi:hypothetical protein
MKLIIFIMILLIVFGGRDNCFCGPLNGKSGIMAMLMIILAILRLGGISSRGLSVNK